MQNKQIQIPEALFTQMCAYFLMPEFQTEQNVEAIKRGINAKLDRMVEHDLYTKYKTAPTAEQKEQARKEYLDRKGISDAFRW